MHSHPETPIIKLSDVSMRWSNRTVLSDVNLTVNCGDFLAITGPNGGGKTTLLRLMLKLIKPSKGSVTYFPDPHTSRPPRIGYLPQKNALDSHFPITVHDVVASGLIASKGLDSAECQSRIDHVLDLMQLHSRRNYTIGQISGGQLQRTLIARALVSRPDVLVFDEPLSYLDKDSEARIYDIIAEILDKTTIVLVSHEMSHISAMANRHIIVDRTIEECHAGHHYFTLDCPCP